jgi:homoserine O-succinyltransferase
MIVAAIHNTWHDTAEAVIDNWIGKVYQITNFDRRLPFAAHIDPNNPLGLRK